jgi:tetratricopeptide (TPR) repeat protein
VRRFVLPGLLGMAVLALAADRIHWLPIPGPSEANQDASQTDGPSRPEWMRGRALEPTELPPEPEVVTERSVLFFPTLNRSRFRLHPALSGAFDRTLAVYASAFLGLEPVAPWAAEAVARELGAPAAYSRASTFALDDALAARAARRVGAASIVWVELGPDLTVRVSARDFGAPAVASWHGLEIASVAADGQPGGDLDRSLYDAPRKLLSALRSSGRLPARAPEGPPSDGPASLRAAIALQGAGSLGEFRESERSLAALATRHPHWAEPWVELAAVRVRRALVDGVHDFDSAVLGDGPLAARHIALAIGGLAPATAGRLAAVDNAVLVSASRDGELESVLAALAPDDPMRALLAYFYWCRPREGFDLKHVRADELLDRLFLAAGAAGGEAARREAVNALATSIGRDATFASPPILGFFEDVADDRNDWAAQIAFSIGSSFHSAAGAFDVARELCLPLAAGAPAARDCWKSVRDGIATYVTGDELPGDAAALADDTTWRHVLSVAMAKFFDPEIAERNAARLPDVAGLEWPPFRPLWLLAATLSDTANGALRARERSELRALPGELAMADARAQLSGAIDQVLSSAYGGAQVGYFRGQPKETTPYLKALRPFIGYPIGASRFAKLTDSVKWSPKSGALFRRFAGSHPYESVFVNGWIHHSRYDHGYTPTAEIADWLGTLVPRTLNQTLNLVILLDETGHSDDATRLLDQGLARRFDDWLMEARADRVPDALGSEREKLKILEPVVARFPFRYDLIAEIGNLHARIGHYDQAREIAKTLLAQPEHFESACHMLVYDAAHAGNVASGVELYESCAEHAPDKWKRASLLASAAAMRNELGDHGRALALYRAAENEIGGAGYVLSGIGSSSEWAGDYDGARIAFEQIVELYPKFGSAYRSLAMVALRRGDTQAARRAMEDKKKLDASELSEDDYRTLGAIFVREGKLAGFENLCIEAKTWDAAQALADAREGVLGPAKAAEIPASLKGLGTGSQRAELEATYLMHAGRYADAVPLLETAMETDTFWVRAMLVEAYVRSGRSQKARERVVQYRTAYPTDWGAHYLEAWLALAEGRRSDAASESAKLRATFPNRGSIGWCSIWSGSCTRSRGIPRCSLACCAPPSTSRTSSSGSPRAGRSSPSSAPRREMPTAPLRRGPPSRRSHRSARPRRSPRRPSRDRRAWPRAPTSMLGGSDRLRPTSIRSARLQPPAGNRAHPDPRPHVGSESEATGAGSPLLT